MHDLELFFLRKKFVPYEHMEFDKEVFSVSLEPYGNKVSSSSLLFLRVLPKQDELLFRYRFMFDGDAIYIICMLTRYPVLFLDGIHHFCRCESTNSQSSLFATSILSIRQHASHTNTDIPTLVCCRSQRYSVQTQSTVLQLH